MPSSAKLRTKYVTKNYLTRNIMCRVPDKLSDGGGTHSGSFLRFISEIEFISSMSQARFRRRSH